MALTPDKCPWCGEGEHKYYRKTNWFCGSQKGYQSRPPEQSDRCRIRELEAEVEQLRAALVLACTPPYKTGGTSGIADETLVRFFLRQAAKAAGEDGG